MEDLRVGLIGYGLAGAVFHAPMIDATPGLRIATIVTANSARAAAARARYPAVDVAPSADALWANPRAFDLIVVAAPNRAHEPLASAAIAAGLPVVVDKPLVPSSDAAGRLAAAARDAGVPVIPFHNRRWDGDFLTLRRLLAEGAIGDVLRFESRFERWLPKPRPGARRDSAAAEDAGGVLFDLGAHLIDQALALFGRVLAVYAEVERRRPGPGADDDTFVALTHASGVRSHLWASHMAAAAGPRLRVLGTRAAYVKHGLDVQASQLQAGGRPGEPRFGRDPGDAWGELRTGDGSRSVQTERGDYVAFYRAVRATVHDGAPPPVSLDDAIAGLRIIEAAFASNRDGRIVSLAT